MGTKRYILSAGNSGDTNYSLVTIPRLDGTGLDLKILRISSREIVYEKNSTLSIPETYEVLEWDDNLFYEILSTCQNSSVAAMIDPYLRWKLGNTELFPMVYYQINSSDNPVHSSDFLKFYARNLIVLDMDALRYIYYLTKNDEFKDHRKAFEHMLTCELPYNPNGKNARQRLCISKNKERILKVYFEPWILQYDNVVFEDDVNFLLKMLKPLGYEAENVLRKILYIKKINPQLTYQQIAKKAILMNLNNTSLIRFSEAIRYFNYLAQDYESFKSRGFDKPFKLSTIVPITSNMDFRDQNIAPTANFTIDNGSVYPIQYLDSLYYTNTISNAVPHDYLKTALNAGSQFYLIVKRGRYYLAESKDGVVINLKPNGKNSYLYIKYKAE